MVTIEYEQVSFDVEHVSHIKKRSEVLTVAQNVESSDVSRNPLSLFNNTLAVSSYAEQTNLHHWRVPTTNSRSCYHD
jgi:hypothetical protein